MKPLHGVARFSFLSRDMALSGGCASIRRKIVGLQVWPAVYNLQAFPDTRFTSAERYSMPNWFRGHLNPPGVNANAAAANDPLLLRLLCSMEWAYGVSKRWLALSVVSLCVSVGLLAYYYFDNQREKGALLALVFQLAAFWCKGRFVEYYRKGHAFELAALLNCCLGEKPPLTLDLKDSKRRLDANRQHYQSYFYSRRVEEGPRKLVESIAECAYFIKEIAKGTHSLLNGLVMLGAVIILTAICVGIVAGLNCPGPALAGLFSNREWAKTAVEVAFLALGFIAAGDLALMGSQYGYLARKVRHVYGAAIHELESAKPLRVTTAMTLLLEYSSLLMETPPISSLVYRNKRKELNRRWREIGESLAALPILDGEEIMENGEIVRYTRGGQATPAATS